MDKFNSFMEEAGQTERFRKNIMTKMIVFYYMIQRRLLETSNKKIVETKFSEKSQELYKGKGTRL